MRRTMRQLRHLPVRNEDGIALVVALGVMFVLTVAATALIAYTSANSRSASFGQSNRAANSLAEAGLEYARAALYQAPQAQWLSPTALPPRTVAVEGRTVTYWGTLTGNRWTLYGSVAVPNPSGGTSVTSTVSAEVDVATTTVATPETDAAWGYLFADSTGKCAFDAGSGTIIDAPLYVRGDLCMGFKKKGMTILSDKVYVGGVVNLTGRGKKSSVIGTASDPVEDLRIAKGCVKNDKGKGKDVTPQACTQTDGIFGNVNASVPALAKPPVDLPYWYVNAKPGPRQYCTSGSFPTGRFDSDNTINASLGRVDLTPATGYDCRVVDAANNLLGQLTWIPGSPGRLIVFGTIFVDGDLVVGNPLAKKKNGYTIVYEGRGVIYAGGTVNVVRDTRLCNNPTCAPTWYDDPDRLVIVAGTSREPWALTVGTRAVVQGGLYAVGDYLQTKGARVYGGVIADEITLKNSKKKSPGGIFGEEDEDSDGDDIDEDDSETPFAPFGPAYEGMPGTFTSAAELRNAAGSYRRRR